MYQYSVRMYPCDHTEDNDTLYSVNGISLTDIYIHSY